MRSVLSLFEPSRRRHASGLPTLVISDYLTLYQPRDESPRRLALLFLPRVIHNPSLHATILLRLATRGPRALLGLWRNLLIAKHSIDIGTNVEIGPGLLLPHPISIVIGVGTRIGIGVTIVHDVTLGALHHHPTKTSRPCPVIEDDVVIYSQSMIVGPVTIGTGAVIGARSWIDHDVAPGTVHHGATARQPGR